MTPADRIAELQVQSERLLADNIRLVSEREDYREKRANEVDRLASELGHALAEASGLTASLAAARAEVASLTVTLASCNRARQEEGRQRDAAREEAKGLLEALARGKGGTVCGVCGGDGTAMCHATTTHGPFDREAFIRAVVDETPWCEREECKPSGEHHGSCHIHKSDMENALDKVIRSLLGSPTARAALKGKP